MSRGRKPAAPATAVATVNEALVADDLQRADELATHVAEIDAAYGDGLPYDRERLVNETRFYMAQSAEAMLEAGKRLIRIKEHEPHGDFQHIVEERLGMAARTARAMMQAAIKFMTPELESKRQAFAVLGKAKLLELVTQDDDELAELAEGGTVAGLTLDDIDRMSVRELKAALREAKEDARATDKILADKNRKLDELAIRERPASVAPDFPAQFAGLNDEIGEWGNVLDEAVGKQGLFLDATETLMDQLTPAEMAAGKSCIHRLGETIERLCHLAAQLRNEYETRLAGYVADDKTHLLPEGEA